MANKFYSIEFKHEVVMAYKSGHYTIQALCSKFKIPSRTLYDWVEKNEKSGISGLEDSRRWKSYSKELKEAAMKDYLSGEYSQYEIVRKYEISSRTVLLGWVKKYNGHRELKDTEKGTVKSMAKGRKTTWEERIQIAIDSLENRKDYKRTAEKYEVSYQQVYRWVRKYEADGAGALKDKRGRAKEEEKLLIS